MAMALVLVLTHCRPLYGRSQEGGIFLPIWCHTASFRQPNVTVWLFLPDMVSFEIAIGNEYSSVYKPGKLSVNMLGLLRKKMLLVRVLCPVLWQIDARLQTCCTIIHELTRVHHH